ncbi:MAG: prepilin-type N-terminal cleavage/methylation domain-containing protein [Thermodesulfobacteriota bacterium]|nr:prepilin-type N-terminal cleavage/methylation domain-containing protein [Thermodesulfobacteriota bacterium]
MLSPSTHNTPARYPGGFTLIELIVVLVLLAIVLAVTFPRVSNIGFSDSRNKTARWIITTTRVLKSKAVMDRHPYVLRVDTSRQTLTALPGATSGTLPAQMAALAGQTPEADVPGPETTGTRRLALSDDLTVEDVTFAGSDTAQTGVVDIVFHAGGYSDWAVIHMRDRGRRISFIIEPFINRVRMVDGYAEL